MTDNDGFPCRYRITEYLAGSPRTLSRVFDTVEDACDAAQRMFDELKPGRRPQFIRVYDMATGRTVRTLHGFEPTYGGPFE